MQHVVTETNNTARTGMDCTPADLFSGRVVRSNTPASARRTIDLAKARKKRTDDQLRIRKRLGRGKLSMETFVVGDHVRLQDPKTLRWSVIGVVTKAISHQGATQPSSYEVTADQGGVFLRNGRYLKLREQQPDTENDDLDNGERNTQPDNSETEPDDDESEDSETPRDQREQAEAEYRENSEGKETYRRSPRLKKQCRVSYKEDNIPIPKNVQKRRTERSRPSPGVDIRHR